MKVILQQDVANLGKKSAVVEVPNGYALNKLIPSGQAIAATAENQKKVAATKEKQAAEHAAARAELQRIQQELDGAPLQIALEANEKGALFQAVAASHLRHAAQDRGLTVSESMLTLPSAPIKEVGEFEITITAGGDSIEVPLIVTAK
jgi:large subunit ribosomal protein L9